MGIAVSEFARRHCVSRLTVRRWRTRGYIVLDPADGRIDAAASDARLRQRPASYRGGRCRGPCAPAPVVDLAAMASAFDTERLREEAERLTERLIASLDR